MITNVRRDAVNQIALEHPEVGDIWCEMLNVTCRVTAVTPDTVTIIRHDGEATMQRGEFKQWLSYKYHPDKTWADYYGKQ